jgi:hypothetical protein
MSTPTESSYAITFTPAAQFDRMTLAQFLLMMTYMCQPQEVPGVKFVHMFRILKEKKTLTLRMSLSDMTDFKTNTAEFEPCLEPHGLSDFMTVVIEPYNETENVDAGLSQYLPKPSADELRDSFTGEHATAF